MVYNRIRLTQWVSILLGCMLLMGWNLLPAQAEPAVEPAVVYTAPNNTITIGTASSLTPGTEELTFAALKTKLDGQGGSGALVDQGNGIWLLKAKLFVYSSAKLLVVKTGALSELRLESPAQNPVFIQVQNGGHLVFDGVKVTSWDTALNKPDENIADQRSYIDAVDGAKMDILNNSDVGYLGWSTSPTFNGLTWRKPLSAADPLTGATGRIENSKIHHNFVGMYVFAGYGLSILNTEIFSNQNEGLLVRDGSRLISVTGSNVHDNGADGMNFINSTELTIDGNKVYANAKQGILLESGSHGNTIKNNETYNHAAGDGIAIALSNNNVVTSNNSHNNKSGIRVSGNATTMATNNQIDGNTVTANENGINLYGHADRNFIRNNQVQQNTANGIYIKSGGNRVEKNIVSNANATGIGISADTPDGLQGAEVSGSNNVIVGSSISGNSGAGIKITGGGSNRIGVDPQAPAAADSNVIEGNSGDGIAMSVGTNSGIGTTDTLVFSNTIRTNGANGVAITGAASLRNRITRNIMTANGSNAIKVSAGAQGAIAPPVITAVLADNEAQGTAVAGGTVEVYTDPAGQAQNFWGSATVGGDGKWKFQVPVGQDPKRVTALVIDANGNTSAVSARSGSTAGPFYKVDKDEAGQTTIFATGNGASVTLNTIKTGLGAANVNLLVDKGSGIWELNANMMIAAGVTLDLSQATGVKELRLRSQPSAVVAADASAAPNVLDLNSFVYLRTHDGSINIDGVKIYSWDGSAPDVDIENGRAYIIAKYTAQMFITNSEISYLGSLVAGTEGFGVTWRDSNDPLNPSVLRTRVTGEVQNSKFHHNYIGVYAIQAQNMTFRNNEFHDNLRYGFNGDDFSHDFLVENNQAYNNVSHGFILSRGVKLFTLRGNKSYNNTDPGTSVAHGFVLDPGSPTPDVPATPSTENLFENNDAYGNEGVGMRIVGCNNNTVRGNRFFQNIGGGISIEQGSTANNIEGNQVTNNQASGVTLRNTADGNIVASNVISKNVDNGIYIRSSSNNVNNNNVSGNTKAGIAFTPDTGATVVQNNQVLANTVTGNGTSGIDVRGSTNAKIDGNIVTGNTQHGVYLTDGATNNLVTRNELRNNGQQGIRCSGLSAFGNKWSENAVFANTAGGVAVTDNANSNIGPAVSLAVKERVLTGSAKPDSTVEVFTDDNSQGRFYHGSAVVQADGKFTFTLISGKWRGAQITTVVTDAQGNSSVYSSGILAPNVPDNVFMPLVRR